MSDSNLLTLAKQGNPKAIAAMLNKSLQPKGITAKAGVKENCLQILLESEQIPDQEAMVSYIRKGLINLGVESIKSVKVYGRQKGIETPAWNQQFELAFPEEKPESPELIDDIDLSSYQMVQSRPRSTARKVETPSQIRETNTQDSGENSAISNNPSLQHPMGPLSVGNVVSAALVLYRSHLKTYLRLALYAHLWLLLPIYGWAKYTAISGLISRLAFGELTNQPESIDSARNYIKPRMWSFLRVALQVILMLMGIYLGLFIIFYLGGLLVGFALGLILGNLLGNIIVLAIMIGILGIVVFVSFLYVLLWYISRWLVAEVPLAVEERINGKQSIKRSWELTKNSVRRIQGVVLVAFLVTLPFVFFMGYLPQILLIFTEEGSSLFWSIYFISLFTIFIGGILVLPFWQAIKAVLYYDLRSRREGLDLRVRNSMSENYEL